MAYGDFKDLTRRIASDKMLRDKPFNFAKKKPKKTWRISKRSCLNGVYILWLEKFRRNRLKKYF